VRAEFLRARKLDYVRAARALGVPNWQIMLRHILPNALVAVLTFLPFLFADSIALLAGLNYLGFGLPPDSPSLGELAAQAQNNPQAPWLAFTALITLGGLLFLLVCIGEALRTAFDPRQNG
jgi:microcin C transport system permease protein